MSIKTHHKHEKTYLGCTKFNSFAVRDMYMIVHGSTVHHKHSLAWRSVHIATYIIIIPKIHAVQVVWHPYLKSTS